MTRLLITEITRMGPAFCVIGLQHEQQKFHSIRPVSSSTHGWKHFPYQRGEILECSLVPFSGTAPHVELLDTLFPLPKADWLEEF
jgi:hypothetical protein